MKRRQIGESKDVRIEKRLKFISELYNLAFVTDGVDKDIIQSKRNLKLVNDEKELVNCCKQIAEQIVLLEKTSVNESSKKARFKVASSLREVFYQIKSLIQEEFRTIRNRNNRLPHIETY